jgi:hypothetical protein
MNSVSKLLVVGLSAAAITSTSAAIIFDDFNTGEGHFGYAPGFSSTSVGEDATSTADQITTDNPFEGAGHQKLVLVHDTTTTALRIRHLSGGPPYNSANAGTPVGNTGFSFTTGAGVDGWIGFYLRTTATGWQTSINLDGAGGTAAEMDGSLSVPIIADGEWHLYEWDLDAVTGWGAVPGIGGGHGGAVLNGTHTIDSIYFRDLDGSPGPTAEIYIDFVAKSDVGSIATLVPEPGVTAVLGIGIASLIGFRRMRK